MKCFAPSISAPGASALSIPPKTVFGFTKSLCLKRKYHNPTPKNNAKWAISQSIWKINTLQVVTSGRQIKSETHLHVEPKLSDAKTKPKIYSKN